MMSKETRGAMFYDPKQTNSQLGSFQKYQHKLELSIKLSRLPNSSKFPLPMSAPGEAKNVDSQESQYPHAPFSTAKMNIGSEFPP